MRENAADSPGFSVGHEKNQEWAANISRGASYFRGQAQLYTRMADVMRDVGSAHENIDSVAHNELAAAKTNLERGAIIATHHGDARIAAVQRRRDARFLLHGLQVKLRVRCQCADRSIGQPSLG